MANCRGFFLSVVLISLIVAPRLASAADEPVASAPIPPAPATATAPPHPADKPSFVNPMAAKPSAPKASETPLKRLLRSTAKSEQARLDHDQRAASRHRPSRQTRREKTEKQHVTAHVTPPVRRPPHRPRVYAGDWPPPPPWYGDGPVYYPGPWRRSPVMPW